MNTFSIPVEFEDSFDSLSKKTGRSTEELLREAMANFIEDMEDREDAKEAKRILDEYRQNPGQPFTLDDALGSYGLTRDDLTA